MLTPEIINKYPFLEGMQDKQVKKLILFMVTCMAGLGFLSEGDEPKIGRFITDVKPFLERR